MISGQRGDGARCEHAPGVCAFAVAVSLLLFAGCSGKHADKPSSQVAAKVNSYEITAYQLNSKLARVPSLAPESVPAAKRQILDGLIDQELAVEQAIARKLDRSAAVQAALDDARREILARAYLEDVARGITKPSHEEISQYYTAHPELFSQRRIYTIKEITVKDSPEVSDYAKSFVASGKPIEQFGQWLQSKGIRFGANASTRPAESLPLELVPKLMQVKDGGLVMLTTDQGLYVAQVMSSQAAPVPEQAAEASIERFIDNQRGREAIANETKRLRSIAKIEYGAMVNTGSTPATPDAPTQGQATAPPSKAGAADPPDSDVIKRGIGGLK